MDKIIAIVIGIVLVGAVLYATGVFGTEVEEPIESELVGGSFKHVVVVEYADGTTKTVTDSNLGSIWYDGAEMMSIQYYLYVKPMNSATTSFTKVDMAFPAIFKMIYDLDCVAGDAYDAGVRSVASNSPTGDMSIVLDNGLEEEIHNLGYRAFDVNDDFQEVGWSRIYSSVIELAWIGTPIIGDTGTYELRAHYTGDASFKLHTTESTPGFSTPAPLIEMVLTVSTEADGTISDLSFDWDMGL